MENKKDKGRKVLTRNQEEIMEKVHDKKAFAKCIHS